MVVDLREKIKQVIDNSNFSALNDNSVELIQKIFEGYEVSNNLHQDFENIPKNAELIFVAAPTGAGKDSLVVKLKKENPDKNYIELNMDIFRHYYPEFIKDVGTLSDATFAEKTNDFSYEMYVTIQEILLTEFPGTNIIITGTLRKTDWVEETFKKYKANELTNYIIKLVSLAVPKKVSGFSVIERYVDIIDVMNQSQDFLPGTARYTSKEYHDETYDIFPKNIEYFENQTFYIDKNGNKVLKPEGERLIDVFEVYKRSQIKGDTKEDTLIYSSEMAKFQQTTALKEIERIREVQAKPDNNDVIDVLNKMIGNCDYLKNQGLLFELMNNLAEIIEFTNKINELIARKLGMDISMVGAGSGAIEGFKREKALAKFEKSAHPTEIVSLFQNNIPDELEETCK